MKFKFSYVVILVLAILALSITACAVEPETVEVIKTVEVEKIVEKEVEKEIVKTVEVEKEVVKEVMVTGSTHEAPALAGLVAAGNLAPLAERLPVNPKVVEPHEEVGQYGGTWRMGLRGGGDNALFQRTLAYEQLVRWSPDWAEVEPNVAESFEVNDEASEFTFNLRQGMKWSDGEDFNADDIMFWYEYVVADDEVTPSKPNWLVINDKLGVVEKVDDYTVIFKFAGPNGLFLQQMATPDGWQILTIPEHYMKQFHPDFNPDGIDALVEERGFATALELFQHETTEWDARFQDANRPTLWAWMFTQAYEQGTTLVSMERNPYYWKVDSAGNQLPYIDRVLLDVGDDVEVLVLKALNGEIDMQDRHIGTPTNKAVFFDNQERGGYRFFETIPSSMNTMIISLNWNHQDPVMQEIIQNKDFRIGLSHAINRQEIIDVVYVGQGIPYQAAPRPESPFYDEKMATQYTEYDVDLANEHLDEAGLTERDSEGYRLRPDGDRLVIAVEVASVKTYQIDMLELIQGYWKDVGIDMQVKSEDRSILYERKDANEHDAVVWDGDGGMELFLEPRFYFPYSHESNFAVDWNYWYNGDPRGTGEEPPENVQKMMSLYDQIKATGDEAKQAELMTELLDMSAEQFWTIGISLPAPGYGIVNENMRNVPESFPNAWKYPHPAPTNPEQYFYVQ